MGRLTGGATGVVACTSPIGGASGNSLQNPADVERTKAVVASNTKHLFMSPNFLLLLVAQEALFNKELPGRGKSPKLW
jgi:hypothetical protein